MFKVGDLVYVDGRSLEGDVQSGVGRLCRIDGDIFSYQVRVGVEVDRFPCDDVKPVPEHFYVELPTVARNEWSKKLQEAAFESGLIWNGGQSTFHANALEFIYFESRILHDSYENTETTKLTPEDALLVLQSRVAVEPSEESPNEPEHEWKVGDWFTTKGYSFDGTPVQLTRFTEYGNLVFTAPDGDVLSEEPELATPCDPPPTVQQVEVLQENRQSAKAPVTRQGAAITYTIGPSTFFTSLKSLGKPMNDKPQTTIERRIAKNTIKVIGWPLKRMGMRLWKGTVTVFDLACVSGVAYGVYWLANNVEIGIK